MTGKDIKVRLAFRFQLGCERFAVGKKYLFIQRKRDLKAV